MPVYVQRHITLHTVKRATHKCVWVNCTWCWSGIARVHCNLSRPLNVVLSTEFFNRPTQQPDSEPLNTPANFVYRRYSNKDKCIPSNICSHCRHKTLYRVESRSRAFSLDNSFSSCLHVFSCAYRPVGMLRCCPKPVIQQMLQIPETLPVLYDSVFQTQSSVSK